MTGCAYEHVMRGGGCAADTTVWRPASGSGIALAALLLFAAADMWMLLRGVLS